MNAAARVINQGTVFNGQLTDMQMSKSQYMLIMLLISVLISALAVVYSTNSYRSTFSQLEQQKAANALFAIAMGAVIARTS